MEISNRIETAIQIWLIILSDFYTTLRYNSVNDVPRYFENEHAESNNPLEIQYGALCGIACYLSRFPFRSDLSTGLTFFYLETWKGKKKINSPTKIPYLYVYFIAMSTINLSFLPFILWLITPSLIIYDLEKEMKLYIIVYVDRLTQLYLIYNESDWKQRKEKKRIR